MCENVKMVKSMDNRLGNTEKAGFWMGKGGEDWLVDETITLSNDRQRQLSNIYTLTNMHYFFGGNFRG